MNSLLDVMRRAFVYTAEHRDFTLAPMKMSHQSSQINNAAGNEQGNKQIFISEQWKNTFSRQQEATVGNGIRNVCFFNYQNLGHIAANYKFVDKKNNKKLDKYTSIGKLGSAYALRIQ